MLSVPRPWRAFTGWSAHTPRAATRFASGLWVAAAAAPVRPATCWPRRPACGSSRSPTPLPIVSTACRERLADAVPGHGHRGGQDHCFVGLDAYQQLLKTDVNYVILATPPGFRATHIAAAIAAGKNIFAEKPVAVDAAGVRSCLALADEVTQARHRAGRRHAVPPLRSVHPVDEAHPRRRDRPAHWRACVLQHGRAVEARSPAGLERSREPDAQLALLHLALRRSHRRAVHPQHRRA